MIWVTWRQFRGPALVTVAALVVFAVLLGVTGAHLHHLYSAYQAKLAICKKSDNDCGQLTNAFLAHDHHLFQYLDTFMVAVPGLIGIFWGPPLIGRELETGSHRLAWSQSVTRSRWLAAKLGIVGLAAMVTAGLFSLILTWWAGPIDHVNMDRFASEIFSERGIVPIGYAAFAFALGATLGVLIRRTLPAMAVTLVGFVAVRQAIIGLVRPHLIPATHIILPLRSATSFGFDGRSGATTFFASGAGVPNALVVSSKLVDTAGQPPSAATLQQFVRTACPAIASPPVSATGNQSPAPPGAFNECMQRLSLSFHEKVSYIPASRYWDLQLAETAVYLVLAALLVAGCFWWVRHRIT
jgi:ABC-type transport system involved in multi-copper enzyme maturation permease subunit